MNAQEQYSLPIGERWNNRAIFLLLWPLVIEQLLGVTVGLVDTMMVSSVGEHAISGVALVDAIATLFIFVFGALSTGGAVVISRYLGRNDAKNANAAARQLIYVSAGTAGVIMLLALFFRNILLRVIYGNIDADVMAAARTYFFLSALSYPALALYNASAALFRSMGNSRITMKVSLLINIINVLGNAFLIFGLRIGVAGAALSTLASRITGAAILLCLLVKGKRNVISLADISKIKFELAHIRSILGVGIPSGIEHSLFQLGKILVSRVAAGFGTAAIAANAVTGSINSIVIMPGNAIGVAMLIIVSQFIGAGDYTGAKRITKRLMILTHVVMFTVSVCNMIFMNRLVALFSLGPEAHGLAVRFLRLLAVMMIVAWPSSFALPSALRAAGDAKYIMFVAIVSVWLVRVLGAQFLSVTLGAGPIGIWYAWVADWVFRCAFFIPRWLKTAPFQER